MACSLYCGGGPGSRTRFCQCPPGRSGCLPLCVAIRSSRCRKNITRSVLLLYWRCASTPTPTPTLLLLRGDWYKRGSSTSTNSNTSTVKYDCSSTAVPVYHHEYQSNTSAMPVRCQCRTSAVSVQTTSVRMQDLVRDFCGLGLALATCPVRPVALHRYVNRYGEWARRPCAVTQSPPCGAPSSLRSLTTASERRFASSGCRRPCGERACAALEATQALARDVALRVLRPCFQHCGHRGRASCALGRRPRRLALG